MRARNLKPGFFKNEKLGTAEPINAVVFEGLWCLADREGRLEDRPLRIHAEINPYRHQSSTVQALGWLHAEHFIVRYIVDGTPYIVIPTFPEHQNPHVREPPSKIPPPEKGELIQVPTLAPVQHSAEPVPAPVQHQFGPADSGFPLPDSPFPLPDSGLRIPSTHAKGNGHTKKPRKPIRTPCPEGFVLDDELTAYAVKRLPEVDPVALMEAFRGKALANGWVYADWRQAFQGYVRNAMPHSKHFAEGQYPRKGGGIQWQ